MYWIIYVVSFSTLYEKKFFKLPNYTPFFFNVFVMEKSSYENEIISILEKQWNFSNFFFSYLTTVYLYKVYSTNN